MWAVEGRFLALHCAGREIGAIVLGTVERSSSSERGVMFSGTAIERPGTAIEE